MNIRISMTQVLYAFFLSIIFIFFMSNKKHGQIVDHNYLNNIFFLTLSTLQSLQLCAEGKHSSHYKHKLFKNYDKVDYSSKNFLEIQSQLQTELIVLRASMKTFAQEYRSIWNPPSNFDIQSANNFASKAYQFFKSKNDDTSMRLSYDLLSLMNGKFDSLFIDTVQIKGNYSQYQKLLQRNYLKESLSKVKDMMEDQRDHIQGLGLNDVGELKANLNPHYGEQITSKYLVTSKLDYNQYLKGNKGFNIELIEGKMYENKKEAVDKIRGYQSSIRNNYITIQLEICNDTVLDMVIVK